MTCLWRSMCMSACMCVWVCICVCSLQREDCSQAMLRKAESCTHAHLTVWAHILQHVKSNSISMDCAVVKGCRVKCVMLSWWLLAPWLGTLHVLKIVRGWSQVSRLSIKPHSGLHYILGQAGYVIWLCIHCVYVWCVNWYYICSFEPIALHQTYYFSVWDKIGLSF